MRNKQKKIQIASNKMRRAILETSFNCGASAHIGGALSMVEILACLYQGVLNTKGKNRDIFILSKGHGFLALLSALYIKKFISKKKLMTFQSNGSEIIAHPIMDPRMELSHLMEA